MALVVFVAAYLASFTIGLWLRLPYSQWIALLAVVIATVVAIASCESGRWALGLSWRQMPRAGLGIAFAVALIGTAAALIAALTPLRHGRGNGFPWNELVFVYLPAVFHEELLFRGYGFQKLYTRSRAFAILGVSAAFAALHGWNEGITPLALVNIFLGGVLLSLAYAIRRDLWFPLGIHLGWNLMSGPILGYNVSGFIPEESMLTVIEAGPPLATGGAFGIEGSVVMTVVEAVAIVLLLRKLRISNEEFRIRNS